MYRTRVLPLPDQARPDDSLQLVLQVAGVRAEHGTVDLLAKMPHSVLAPAVELVAAQACCSLNDALSLMSEHAHFTGGSLEDVAMAVVEGRIRFTFASDGTGPG